MKKNALFLVFLFFFLKIYSQSETFVYTDLETNIGTGISALETTNGTFILSVYSTNEWPGTANPRIVELNQDGQLVRENTIVNGRNESIFEFIEVDNTYLGIGRSFITSNGIDSSYVWISTFNSELELISSNYFEIGNEKIGTLRCTNVNDTIYCSGSKLNDIGTPVLPFIFVFEKEIPNVLISVTENLGFNDVVSICIPIPNENNVYLSNGTFYRKLDEAYNEIIQYNAPFELQSQGDLKTFSENTFLSSGKYVNPFNVQNREIGIGISNFENLEEIKLELIGKPNDTIDFPAFYKSIDFFNNDKIYCGGTSNVHLIPSPFGTIPAWFVLAQFDDNLNKNWERYYGGDAYYNMYGILATQDEGCLMYGFRHDFFNNPNSLELYAIKVGESGDFVSSVSIPLEDNNFNIYPNPFSEEINISLNPNFIVNNLKFEIYDVTGKLVLAKDMNVFEKTINTSSLYSGSYICVLRNKTKGILARKKIIKR